MISFSVPTGSRKKIFLNGRDNGLLPDVCLVPLVVAESAFLFLSGTSSRSGTRIRSS